MSWQGLVLELRHGISEQRIQNRGHYHNQCNR